MRTLLFVCTGNTCRSPMAEAIGRHHLEQRLGPRAREFFVASAGIGAGEGAATSLETTRALRELGIDHAGRSKRLTAPMIRNADLILCMTAAQQASARELVADSQRDMEKIIRIDPAQDIEDPVGMGQDAYDSLARRLMRLVPVRLDEALPKLDAAAGIEDPHEDRSGIGSSR